MFLQPPIQVYGVEGRYATALFSAASKQKSLDKVEQELGRVFVSFTLDFPLFVCACFIQSFNISGFSLIFPNLSRA